MLRLMCFLLLPLFLMPNFAFADSVRIAISPGSEIGYQLFLRDKGGDPLKVENFVSLHATRSVADLVLLIQALRLGGCDKPIEFHSIPNFARGMREVKTGRATVLHQDAWEKDFDETVFKTKPVVRRGEFKKAIYGRADNSRVMGIRSIEDIRPLVGLSGLSWTVDNDTLRGMGVAKIVLAPKYDLHFDMIRQGRADFGLLELSCASHPQQPLPGDLAIVEGVAVSLDGSRHFMVSKKHPLGPEVFAALERGLAILRKKGKIRRAMMECGFINPILNNWMRIYP